MGNEISCCNKANDDRGITGIPIEIRKKKNSQKKIMGSIITNSSTENGNKFGQNREENGEGTVYYKGE